MSMLDLEMDVQRAFPSLQMEGQLSRLEQPMIKSRAAYSKKVVEMEKDPNFLR